MNSTVLIIFQSHSMLLLEVPFLPVWLPASIDYHMDFMHTIEIGLSF